MKRGVWTGDEMNRRCIQKRTSAGRGKPMLASPRRTVTIRSRKRTIGTVADPGAAQHQEISPRSRPTAPSVPRFCSACSEWLAAVSCSGWPVFIAALDGRAECPWFRRCIEVLLLTAVNHHGRRPCNDQLVYNTPFFIPRKTHNPPQCL